MSSENFLDFLNSGDGCTILRTYKKIGIVYFIYLYFGWIIRYRNCILIKLLKKKRNICQKKERKNKEFKKTDGGKQMEYLFAYGAKWGEIKEKETTKRWQEIGKDVGTRDMSWERQTCGDIETRLHLKKEKHKMRVQIMHRFFQLADIYWASTKSSSVYTRKPARASHWVPR